MCFFFETPFFLTISALLRILLSPVAPCNHAASSPKQWSLVVKTKWAVSVAHQPMNASRVNIFSPDSLLSLGFREVLGHYKSFRQDSLPKITLPIKCISEHCIKADACTITNFDSL